MNHEENDRRDDDNHNGFQRKSLQEFSERILDVFELNEYFHKRKNKEIEQCQKYIFRMHRGLFEHL